MNISDPIADMLTRIRNAGMARHADVLIPHSKPKVEIARILKEEGFIADYSIERDKHTYIKVTLRYRDDKRPLISGLKRVSRPGLRTYVGYDKIPLVLGGIGSAILSTPKGMMTGRQARREHLGGEVICYVW